MKRFLIALAAVLTLGPFGAWAVNYTVTQGSGTTFGSLVVATINYAQQLVCDPTTPSQCLAVDSSGVISVKQGTAANLNMTAAQPTAANLNATVVGTGTFVTQSTVTQGTSSNLKAQVDPLTAASWGIGTSTQNSTVATNGQLALGQFNTTPTTITSTNMSPLQLDNAGNLLVNIKSPTFNANGRATAANSSPSVMVAAASTAGAIVPNNTTAVVVKASAGTLFGVQLGGIGSAPAYLKIYNAASATCGSGTPVKRLIIPAASTAANGGGSNVTFGPGLAFGTGITYCVTTGIGDADTTAPAASTYLVNVDFE